MKKRISCILLICLILGVCACNAREEESVQEEKRRSLPFSWLKEL
jgi:PBP1b-binding outer membrane lipoprotein LpoB